MGRELQKRKRRSGLSKVTRKPPSKKKLLANPIIAANWNQKETLTQNYRRLGLASKLNSRAGGQEKDVTALDDDENADGQDDGMIVKNHPGEEAHIGEVRIEQDEDGNTRVVEVGKKPNPLNDPLNDLEDSGEEWAGFDNLGHVANPSGKTPVIAALEEHAMKGVRKAPRKQSQREEEWIERLVTKYGDDYRKMARDARLNPMQQTEADIKKRVQKWKSKNQ